MDEVRVDVRASLRLTQEQRVKTPDEFAVVKKDGKRASTKSFTFNLLKREGVTRLGLVVTKKVGNSPRRNKIRRLLREVFRLRQDLFPVNCDVVIIARTGCAVTKLNEVIAELESASLTSVC